MKTEFSAETNRRHHLSQIVDWVDLVKLPISLMNVLAAIAGYVVCRPLIDSTLILMAVSVGILACGSAVLNNYQDREIDGLFPRTRQRPLPRQSISPGSALAFSMILILCGLFGLFVLLESPFATGLGVLAAFLYNGLYTPLKNKTILAIVPGTMCGMLPVLIGWFVGGGDVFLPQILILMTLFGLWQLPHFWLILLSDSETYRIADLPNMLHYFSVNQLHRLQFIWILAFTSMAMFLPVIEAVINPWLGGLLILCMILTLWSNSQILRVRNGMHRSYSFYFNWLNGSMGVVLLVIILDRLL
jgi:protoheme IX farnesyltransferase